MKKASTFGTQNQSQLQGRIDGFMERKLAQHPDLSRSVGRIMRELEADEFSAHAARSDSRSQLEAFNDDVKVSRFRGLQFAS